jgi:hypothetical protein
MEKNNQNNKKKHMSSSYSWSPKTEKSEVTGNRVLRGLMKVTATEENSAPIT